MREITLDTALKQLYSTMFDKEPHEVAKALSKVPEKLIPPKWMDLHVAFVRCVANNVNPNMLTLFDAGAPKDLFTQLEWRPLPQFDYWFEKFLEIVKHDRIYKISFTLQEERLGLEEKKKTLLEVLNIMDITPEPEKSFGMELLEGLEEARKGHNKTPIGYEQADNEIGGYRQGELWIIAARPSVGKTAYMLNLAYKLVSRGIKAGILSLEMSAKELGVRLAKIHTGKRPKLIMPQDIEDLLQMPLTVDARNRGILEDISARISVMAMDGAKVVFVDYLSLVTVTGSMPLWEKIGLITAEFKKLAQKYDITIVALSQLNREKGDGMERLRYSGAVEQDADVVLFLNREDKGAVEDTLSLHVKKNRNYKAGGAIALRFLTETQQIFEVEPL